MRFFVKNKTILLMKIGEPSRGATVEFLTPQGHFNNFSIPNRPLLSDKK